MRPMAERDYDLVLYGAGGFTGTQAVKYFAQHAQELRWAIAGRNREKRSMRRAVWLGVRLPRVSKVRPSVRADQSRRRDGGHSPVRERDVATFYPSAAKTLAAYAR